jgi:hypothetical protein
MATQPPEVDKLAQKVEELNAFKEERIAALARDMENIRTNIKNLTGGHSVDLREPIDFDAIIYWSSTTNSVLRFLDDGYDSRSVVRIESLATQEAGEQPVETLTISLVSAAVPSQRLSVTVGNSVKLQAKSEGTLGNTGRIGMEDINQCFWEDPKSALHSIDLAGYAVRFTRHALYQEVKAIADKVLSHPVR